MCMAAGAGRGGSKGYLKKTKRGKGEKGEIVGGWGGGHCCSSPRSRVIRLIERVDTFVDQACWVESGLVSFVQSLAEEERRKRKRKKEKHRKPTTHQDHP